MKKFLWAILLLLGIMMLSVSKFVGACVLIAALVFYFRNFQGKKNKDYRYIDSSNVAMGRLTKSEDGILGLYFNLSEQIDNYQGLKSYEKMLDACEKTIPLLKDFVRLWKKAYRSFDISSILAIEVGCRYWSALGRRDNLMTVRKTISEMKELEDGWGVYIESSFTDADLADRIKIYLKENPGCLQNNMGKLLSVSGKDTSRIIHTLENLQLVIRKKKGETYELYPA